MEYENLTQFVSILRVGMCLFCGTLLLPRARGERYSLPLALMFLFLGLSALPGVAGVAFWPQEEIRHQTFALELLLLPLELCAPFLFWLYVRALTTEGDPERVERKALHILPVLLCWLPLLMYLPVPIEVLNGGVEPPEALMPWLLVAGLGSLLLGPLYAGMIAVYLLLTVRRLRAYHSRLRDVFASTENRELRWIWVITICALVFVVLQVLLTISAYATGLDLGSSEETTDFIGMVHEFALLAMLWVIGVWGLRQRPGLSREPVALPPPPPAPEESPAAKYEKSALDEARARRIAGKIEAAMQEDLLYRDPNLSLWDLSKHIGVTSHYVSQTLNAHIGKSFFDYVNHWRIKDAISQLSSTDETILVIAYDVGFNSRSSFYKSFKRETGKTPSDMRKA